MQLMQCALPTASEGICQVEAPAHENLRVTDDFGRVELSCVFYASSDITGEHRPWVASLSADEEEIELGQVPHAGGRTRIVSCYVREHPQTLKFSVTYRDSSSSTHPEEEQLVQEVRQAQPPSAEHAEALDVMSRLVLGQLFDLILESITHTRVERHDLLEPRRPIRRMGRAFPPRHGVVSCLGAARIRALRPYRHRRVP